VSVFSLSWRILARETISRMSGPLKSVMNIALIPAQLTG
jgi:hypothetical protein